MKKCKDCLIVRPVSAFYKHAQMVDGYLNKCKVCVKLRVKRHRLINIEKIRAYDRKRGNRQPKGYLKRYLKENREKWLETKKKWSSNNKIKINAQQKARRAVASGKIKKLTHCERCSSRSVKLHGHHEDYRKPLVVVWLCLKCHGIRHKELNELKRKL